MVWFLKKRASTAVPFLGGISRCRPIGVDISEHAIRMAQLADNGRTTLLFAGDVRNRPSDVAPGSTTWQRWAIDAICRSTSNGRFRGRKVVASIPAGDLVIDHVKVPGAEKCNDLQKLYQAVVSKIKSKLPCQPQQAIIKYVPTEQDNLLVTACDRQIVERHLAIYEQADLVIEAMCVWYEAVANSYAKFFGRRKTDLDAVVLLVQTDNCRTNVVICRHKKVLFARSINIGPDELHDEQVISRLVMELSQCRRQFYSMYTNAHIERLIFLCGQALAKDTCAAVARQLEMPAQVGDCLAAVQCRDPEQVGIDRRNCRLDWTTAFGLSLA